MKKHVQTWAAISGATVLLAICPAMAAPSGLGKPLSIAGSTTPEPRRALNLKSLDNDIEQSLKLIMNIIQSELKKPERDLSDEVRLDFAIDLLGKYRSREAVMFLVDNVSLRTRGIRMESRKFSGFPSVRALIGIGNPSVQEILRRMKPLGEDVEYPDRDLHLFAYIIRAVDGQEIGLFRLQLAAKDATGTHKLNLLNLMEIYEKRESELQIRQAIEPEPEPELPVTQ